MPECERLTGVDAPGLRGPVVAAFTVGPLDVTASASSSELQLSDVHAFASPADVATRPMARLDLHLDEARPPWPEASDAVTPPQPAWDVWGATPAWDADLRCEPGLVRARFSLDAGFVARFSRSRAAALQVLGRAALRLSLAVAAPMAGALLFHGAAAAPPDGRTHLFIGPSGAGKTTIAGRLPGWTVLADDTALVWREHGLWYVSGTPLRGREGHPTRATSALLAAVVVLVPHRSPPRLVALPPAEALHAAFARVFHHPSPAVPGYLRDRLFANLVALNGAVPTFALENDLDAAVEPLLRTPRGSDV
jgi:hypothetical protein